VSVRETEALVKKMLETRSRHRADRRRRPTSQPRGGGQNPAAGPVEHGCGLCGEARGDGLRSTGSERRADSIVRH